MGCGASHTSFPLGPLSIADAPPQETTASLMSIRNPKQPGDPASPSQREGAADQGWGVAGPPDPAVDVDRKRKDSMSIHDQLARFSASFRSNKMDGDFKREGSTGKPDCSAGYPHSGLRENFTNDPLVDDPASHYGMPSVGTHSCSFGHPARFLVAQLPRIPS